MGAFPLLEELQPVLPLMKGGISDEEKRERLAAINFARSSIALEGFKAPDAYEVQALRYSNGEISIQQFVAEAKNICVEIRNG
jgi:hypothetical protein